MKLVLLLSKSFQPKLPKSRIVTDLNPTHPFINQINQVSFKRKHSLFSLKDIRSTTDVN